MVSSEEIKNMLENGLDLSCGRLSIANMTRHTKNNAIQRTGIQVHSEYGKKPFSYIFEMNEMDIAIKKFLELHNVYCR